MDLTLNITNRCNLNCDFCYVEKGEEILEVEDIKSIISQKEIDIVTLTGGEPLLHPEIFDILSLFYSNNIDINIITNGVLLNPDFMEKIEEFSPELHVSYNSPNNKISLKKLNDYEVDLVTHSILFNRLDIKEVKKLFDEIQFADKSLFLYPLKISPERKKPNMPSPEEWNDQINKLRKVARNYDQDVFYQMSFVEKDNSNVESNICPSGSSLMIDTDLKSYPCCISVDCVDGKSGAKKFSIDSKVDCEKCNGGCPVLSKNYGHDPRCNEKYLPICPLAFTKLY